MRKLIFGLVVLGVVATLGAPAQGNHINGWHNQTWTAGVPCAVACPYWLDTANIDIDGNGKEDVFFQACANPDGTADMLGAAPGVPYTEGTVFDDVIVGPAPTNTKLLEVELFPVVDFDGFICALNANGTVGAELAILANVLGENCDNLIGPNNPVPVGCQEKGNIEAAANKKYVIRVYNWSDGATTTGRWRFRSV